MNSGISESNCTQKPINNETKRKRSILTPCGPVIDFLDRYFTHKIFIDYSTQKIFFDYSPHKQNMLRLFDFLFISNYFLHSLSSPGVKNRACVGYYWLKFKYEVHIVKTLLISGSKKIFFCSTIEEASKVRLITTELLQHPKTLSLSRICVCPGTKVGVRLS